MSQLAVEWEDPPESERGKPIDHRLFASLLRSRPGQWARLPRVTDVFVIKNGGLPAYRPAGSFEAVMRRQRVYARYVGEAES